MRRYVDPRGLREAAGAAARRLMRAVHGSDRLIVMVKELDDSIVAPRRRETLRLEDLRAAHLAPLSELNRKRRRPWADRRFARYLAQGFHGFVAFAGTELVGYYWWVGPEGAELFPDLRKLELGIELREGEVYGSDFFVLDEHRGGGVADELLYLLETALRERGASRIWGYVESDNRPARWTYRVRGYRPMWTVTKQRTLMLKRVEREPASTPVGARAR